MTAITHAMSAALLYFVWQGALLAGLAWIALAMLRNSSARMRYVVSCAALGIMTVLPIVTAWVIYRAPAPEGVTNPWVDVAPSAGPSTLAPAALLPVWIAAVESWALPLWFVGVLIFAARLIWISRHVAKLRRAGEASDGTVMEVMARLARRMHTGGGVRVLVSRLAESPCVVGWLRPVILLPAATLLNLSVEQLEAVLAHELAHIRRYDHVVNLLQTLSETLLFYHPATWWVSARIRHERELCCDDMVVATCGDAIGYARALTKLERLRLIAPELTMSGTGGSLLYRIERLTGTPHEQASSKIPAVVSVVLAVVCLAITPRFSIGQLQPPRETAVSRNEVWISTVKHGDLPILVRALGTMVNSTTAELKVAASQAGEVKVGQAASIQPRPGLNLGGRVTRIESATVDGTVAVGIDLEKPVPEFAGANVDGTLQIRALKDVVYVGRPVWAPSDSLVTLFKLEPDGSHATRVKVRFGAASVDSIQVLDGLQTGDRVIVSDMSKYDGYDHIRIE